MKRRLIAALVVLGVVLGVACIALPFALRDRQKGALAEHAPARPGRVAHGARAFLSRRRLGSQELLVVRLGFDDDDAVHAVVTEPAQLGALDVVAADSSGREPHRR